MIQTDHFLVFHVVYASVSQEEAIPELEIDVDELLDMENDVDRAARVKVSFSRITDSASHLSHFPLHIQISTDFTFVLLFFLVSSNRNCW